MTTPTCRTAQSPVLSSQRARFPSLAPPQSSSSPKTKSSDILISSARNTPHNLMAFTRSQPTQGIRSFCIDVKIKDKQLDAVQLVNDLHHSALVAPVLPHQQHRLLVCPVVTKQNPIPPHVEGSGNGRIECGCCVGGRKLLQQRLHQRAGLSQTPQYLPPFSNMSSYVSNPGSQHQKALPPPGACPSH